MYSTYDSSPSQSPPTRWELIALSVTKSGCGPRSVPEGAIQDTSELCCIAHQQNLIRQTDLHQSFLDGADSAIVHVTWGNTICACDSIAHSGLLDSLDTLGIVEPTVLTKNPAVPMRSVLAQADITDDKQPRKSHLQQLDRKDNWAVWCAGLRAGGVFCLRFQGHTE